MKNFDNQYEKQIKKLMSSIVEAFNYEELANNIVEVFTDIFDAELCSIWRRSKNNKEDKLTLSANIGIHRNPGDILPSYHLNWKAGSNKDIEGVTAWIAIKNEVCMANSTKELSKDPSKPWYGAHRGKWDNFQFTPETSFKNLLGLPIIYVSGEKNDEKIEVIGVIKVESTKSGKNFSEKDKDLALRLMPFVGIALQTMAVREQREQNRQQVLRELTGVLLRQPSTTFYQEVANKTAELLRADICSLWLVDDEKKKLTLGANYGVSKKESIPEYDLNWRSKDDDIEGLTPWVVIRKKSFFGEKHEDLEAHPAWRGKWDKDQWKGDASGQFGCLYAVPLLNVDEEPFGVLKIENQAGKAKFDAVDRATFDLIADFIAIAIEFNSRLRSDIVYDFFHLLKQPVSTAIMAFTDLRNELISNRPRKERLESRLDMLARNLQTVSVWITNVYGMAIASQDPTEEEKEITIRDMLLGAEKNMQNLFPEFNCCTMKVDNSVIKVTTLERRKVDAILYNLLDNSFKYSKEPRKIEAEVSQNDREITVIVRDNGLGIAPEDLNRVSERYFTKTPAGIDSEGMGLGLATVDKLIKEFGWKSLIKSKINEGTSFYIIIPKS